MKKHTKINGVYSSITQAVESANISFDDSQPEVFRQLMALDADPCFLQAFVVDGDGVYYTHKDREQPGLVVLERFVCSPSPERASGFDVVLFYQDPSNGSFVFETNVSSEAFTECGRAMGKICELATGGGSECYAASHGLFA